MKKLLSEKEMSKKLAVNRKSLFYWRKQGMPFQIIGKNSVVYDENLVCNWCKENLKATNQTYVGFSLTEKKALYFQFCSDLKCFVSDILFKSDAFDEEFFDRCYKRLRFNFDEILNIFKNER